ncbi:MAG: Tol-Pal system-associated acyl-CoA thioesterase [Rhodospirillales bacterium]|jgi:acyl-CoA thioester hydrolase|nr:Tol-Pal system-associated acyl-CoA thioesterase [Rhodospirillales bacterium]
MHEHRPHALARTHRLLVRVYYEDTDAAGLVYHARYLHFMERARTEMLREAGSDHPKLMAEEGLAFAVRRLAIEFVRPARLDDLLLVETRMTGFSGVRIELDQRVLRGGELVAECALTLVCIDRGGRARRVPPLLLAAFADGPASNLTDGA